MDWPTPSSLIDWIARATCVLLLALVLDRAANRFVRLRPLLWPSAFASILLLFVPLPAINMPILEIQTTYAFPEPKVYELMPGFDYRNATYLGDPKPSLWVLAFFGLIALGLLGFLVQAVRSWRMVKGSEQVTDQELVALVYEVSERYGLNDAPMVVLSDQIESPCVIGVLNPTLVLPVKMVSSLSTDDLHLILCHELGHIKRKDNWKLLALSIVRAILWWNPLAWLAFGQAVKRIEEANDKKSVLSEDQSRSYVKLLASQLVHVLPQGGLRFFGQGNVISRIRSLDGKTVESTSKAAFLALILLAVPILNADIYAHPPLLPDKVGFDEVIFNSKRTGEHTLWRMKSDGSLQTEMPKHFKDCIVPAVSPDGKKIAYVKGDDWDKQDIYISNIDGTGEKKVLATPARDYIPVWGPDSRTLTFSTLATGTWNIGIVDTVTGKWHLVTRDKYGNLESAFHPKGRRLIFSSHRTQTQKLWSINTDGTGLVRLTHGDYEDTGAKYSRDGRYVLYASYRRWKYDVWLLDLATGINSPLSGMDRLDTGEGRFVDGETAVVCSTRHGQETQIGRVNLDGTGFHVITFTHPENCFPQSR